MTGTVKSFTDATGYGSIKTEAGNDVIFASSAMAAPSSAVAASGAKRSPNQGQRVQFDIVQESGRDFATNVILL